MDLVRSYFRMVILTKEITLIINLKEKVLVILIQEHIFGEVGLLI